MANEKTPVVWDDTAKKHRPLGSGEKMGGLSASSMISTDSGNLLQQGSDGLMLVTGGSIADPRADNLLEESDNGKLQVTSDRVVEWLEGHPQAAAAIAEAVKVVSGDSGNVITAGSDKGAFMSQNTLAGAVSTMSAAQLTTLANALRKQGGGLSVGSDGKLSVDFASMDPAIMRNVVLSMVQQGGGIAVDGSGKLYVDFDNMPTDKFEALLKSLKMQIPLSANMNMYVDGANGSDTIIDGRGTEAKPFKTINACTQYVTQNYAVGAYTLTIFVKPGTYVENVLLPFYTRTSGYMILRAYDYANPPLLTATNNAAVITCTGNWAITRLNVAANVTASNDGFEHFVALVGVSNATLTSYGCSFNQIYVGAAPTSGHTYLRSININSSSQLTFGSMHDYTNSIEVIKGNANSADVIFLNDTSRFRAYSTNDADNIVDFEAKGDFDNFAAAYGNSTFYIVGGAMYTPRFVVPSGASATGKCYNVIDSSSIQIPLNQTLPGTIEGTVDSSTYSWYKGGTLQ